MNWQRLDRENTVKVIDFIKSAAEPGLFSNATSEVKRARLSFYENIFLYQITNFASLPSFTFTFLGDGTFFHYMDGTETPIYSMNDKGTLSLNDRSVVDYLDFFMQYVQVDDDEMFLIRNPHDMPLLDSLDPASAAVVISNHKPAVVSYDAGYDVYTIEADVYSEGLVIRATIDIAHNGHVTIQKRQMIVNAVAQAASPEVMV